MRPYKKRNRKRIRMKNRKKIILASCLLILAAVFCMVLFLLFLFTQSGQKEKFSFHLRKEKAQENPDTLLLAYMNCAAKKEYAKMYDMLDIEASGNITKQDFVERNQAIYEGIGMQDMQIKVTDYDQEAHIVTYKTSFDTAAGSIQFENEAFFHKGDDGYRLAWSDAMIFPKLGKTDKVRVSTIQARRGEIKDRKGRVLAGWGSAASVGIVPGKLPQQEQTAEQIAKIAKLLEMEPEAVIKKLEAKWVKKDSFVPIRTLPAVDELALMSIEPDEKMQQEHKRQQKLLKIPGVMIQEVKIREYPYQEAAAHLVGYVQNVTAEDLEEHAGEGYTTSSMIGRSGMEGLFEKELKGTNGCRIYITDENGREKEELASVDVQHGKEIRLTIDAELQEQIYKQFQDDKSCSVAMHPQTGEVLALISTPSYDNNDFILGMSAKQWTFLNEDERKPLYNRFRQAWSPGSTFKPVIAAIGLETGTLNPQEDFGNVGLSWQKDVSWGAYHVTTLHDYQPVILDNALIWSDNIYFAKAALKIGAQNLEDHLLKLNFTKKIPFEITMAKAQFSNTEHLETEIQLADSGYGQGQILINPLHLAGIYTAFCNKGSMIQPYLTVRSGQDADTNTKTDPQEEAGVWIANAFRAETADRVLEGLKKVINDPNGTGYALRRDDVVLAGKTGTAEIKASKDDHTGTELGWMAVFTAEKTAERPILLVSMTEDVKGRGGSGYVVQKVKQVLEYWMEQ